MTEVFLIVGGLVVCFGFVVIFGAPYLPTLSPQVVLAFELADLKPGQSLLELGCGDGRVLIYASTLGLNITGYELNPLLFLIAKSRTWKYRDKVTVLYGNFWNKVWPNTDAIYVFLLPRFMTKLDARISQKTKRNTKLISIAFNISGKDPYKTGNGVYLYQY